MTSTHPIDCRPADALQARVDVALALPPGPLRDAILYAFRELKAQVVHDHDDPSNWSALAAAMEHAGAGVLLFDLTCLKEPDLSKSIGEIKARMPHVRIIAAYPYDDPSRILLAMRAGANEFIHSPVGPALTAALKRTAAARPPDPSRRGKVIGFVSAKGGCGATTVACHVAMNLRRRTGKEVLLAECDTSAGPLDFLMEARGQYSLGDAFDNSSRLDARLWSALLSRSQTGVFVLPAPAQLLPDDCRIESVQRVIRFMRTQHDWVVLDFGRGVNPLLAAVAAELDELVLITTVDLPSLHMAKQMLGTLPAAFEEVPVRLVLNRAQTPAMSTGEIQDILGRPVYAVIPDDYAALNAACANRTPLARNSASGERFEQIAMRLAGDGEPPKRKRFRV